MDPALLRNIALQTNDDGTADAQLALAARRLINKNGAIQFNPDDLPGTGLGLMGGLMTPSKVLKYPDLVGQIIVLLTSTDPTPVAQINASVARPVLLEFKAIPPHAQGGYSGAGISIDGNTFFFGTNYISVVVTTPTLLQPYKSDGAALDPFFVLRVAGFGQTGS